MASWVEELVKEARWPKAPYLALLADGAWHENVFRRMIVRARWAELITSGQASPRDIACITPSDVLSLAIEVSGQSRAEMARRSGLGGGTVTNIATDQNWTRGAREKMVDTLYSLMPVKSGHHIALDAQTFLCLCAKEIMDDTALGDTWKERVALSNHLDQRATLGPFTHVEAIQFAELLRDGFSRDKSIANWYGKVVRVEKINETPCVLIHVSDLENARAFFHRAGALSNHSYDPNIGQYLDVPLFLWENKIVHGIHRGLNDLLSCRYNADKEYVLDKLRNKQRTRAEEILASVLGDESLEDPPKNVWVIKDWNNSEPSVEVEQQDTPATEPAAPTASALYYDPDPGVDDGIRHADALQIQQALTEETPHEQPPPSPEPSPEQVREHKQRIVARVKGLARDHFGKMETAWRYLYDAFFEATGVDPLYEGKKAQMSGVAYLVEQNLLDSFEGVIENVEKTYSEDNRA